MSITTLESVSSILSIIVVSIFIFVGLRIASAYVKYKMRNFLLLGIGWALLSSPWWPSSISFLIFLITNRGLDLRLYLLLGNVLVPLFSMLIIISLTNLRFKKNKKYIVSIFGVIGVLFEIYFLYFLINDPNILGELHGIVDIEFNIIIKIYLASMTIVILIAGMLISKESLRSEKSDIRLKGQFLFLAFVLSCIGAFADATLPLTLLTILIVRLILITGSIMFYLGFLLPKWLKKLILKEFVNK
ncbi:MAG TPA: hypothetical protein VGB37_10660 [Candidatus Lokiarchaeia archaeon]